MDRHSRRGKRDARGDGGTPDGMQYMGTSSSNHAVRLTVLSPDPVKPTDPSTHPPPKQTNSHFPLLIQRTKNRTPTPTISPRSPLHKSLHADLSTRTSNHGGLPHAVRARHRARVAARYGAPAATSGRVDGVLALYEASRDAGSVDGEYRSHGGERSA